MSDTKSKRLFKRELLPKTEREALEMAQSLMPERGPALPESESRRLSMRRCDRKRRKKLNSSTEKSRIKRARYHSGQGQISWTVEELVKLGWRLSRAQLSIAVGRSFSSVARQLERIKAALGNQGLMRAALKGKWEGVVAAEMEGFRAEKQARNFIEFLWQTGYRAKTFRPWDAEWDFQGGVDDSPGD